MNIVGRLALIAVALLSLSACGGAGASGTTSTTAAVSAATQALAGPTGEYAAEASYAAVLEKFGQVEPYVTIHAQELRHIQALTRQLQRLGAEVPDNPWTGTIPAPESLKAAAEAWAQGEVDNVALYDTLAADVDGDRLLTRVFANLRRASQDCHLPMFQAAAAGDGTLQPSQMVSCGGMNGQGP